MTGFRLRAVSPVEAAEMSQWRYEAPFDWYEPGPAELYLEFDTKRAEGYLAIVDHVDEAVGFVCLGQEARVRGQSASPELLDVGIGISPALISRGVVTRALPEVADAVTRLAPGRRIRVAIWSDNHRAMAVAMRAGLIDVAVIDGPGGRSFIEMVQPAHLLTASSC